MEIFSMNSRHISDLLIKFQNKEINKQEFDSNILLDVTFNYFYFKKEMKKTAKLKEAQNKIFQTFFKKETAQETSEKLLKLQVRQKKETPENAHAIIAKQRKELMDNLLKQKDISVYAEHTYNSFIPPKNISLSLNFHISEFKYYKKYMSESGANISYLNPCLSDKDKNKIVNSYCEPAFILDENNDIFYVNKIMKECSNIDIIDKVKTENKNDLKKIINDEEDDLLFYSEVIGEEELKRESKWLKDENDNDINNNFSNLSEVRKNNKTLNNNNYFEFDSNYSISEFNPNSIYDDIPVGGDRYQKFSKILSDKCYKKYIAKMNYNYLDLLFLKFKDLGFEFDKYNCLDKEKIALNFIKKLVLSSGIAVTKIYEHIVKAISNQKGNFDFENFLECFLPIFDASQKYQALKYRFLLFLAKDKTRQTFSMDNYKSFCNLTKGKLIFEDDTYNKLSNNMLENFKQKYPKEYTENFKYFQISTIVEFLVDKECSEQ